MTLTWHVYVHTIVFIATMGVLADAQCDAGSYAVIHLTPTEARRYPPPPRSSSHQWEQWDTLVDRITIDSSLSPATYGLGVYNAVASSRGFMYTAQMGSVFNYRTNDQTNLIWDGKNPPDAFNGAGTYTGTSSLGGKTGQWIYIQLPVPIVLTTYTIYNAYNDADGVRAPQKWYVLGSNDGQTWTQIHYVNNVPDEYYFPNPHAFPQDVPTQSTSFSYYALVIQRHQGTPYSASVGEWIITGYETTASSTCTVCANGKYSNGGGVTACSSCTNGNAYSTYTGPGTSATNCPFTCNAGTYLIGGVCTRCAPGAYGAGGSATTCATCDVGTFSTASGATLVSTCTNCGAGTFSTASGAATCANCGVGTFSTALGATLASTCAVCATGTYTSVEAATTCSSCTNAGNSGTYTGPGTSPTNCPLTCFASTYLSSGLCVPCQDGKYSSPASTSSSACSPCTNAGKHGIYSGPGANATTCPLTCDDGSHNEGNFTCIPTIPDHVPLNAPLPQEYLSAITYTVDFTTTLVYDSPSAFTNDKRTLYKKGIIAAIGGMDPDTDYTLVSLVVTPTSRRRLLSNTIEVSTTVTLDDEAQTQAAVASITLQSTQTALTPYDIQCTGITPRVAHVNRPICATRSAHGRRRRR